MKSPIGEPWRVERSAPTDFVSLPENRSAWLAVRDLTNGLAAGQATVPLLLHGPPGTGKSHLLSQLTRETVRRRPDVTIQTLAPDAWPEAEDSESEPCDLLVIEDLQHWSSRASNALIERWDTQIDYGAALVCTANVGPQQLEFPVRLASRLAGGMVVGLGSLSAPSRRLLLEALARRRASPVATEVLDWLAERLTGNARMLDGTIQQLETLARMGGRLDLDEIAELWADQLEAGRPTLERIARRVSDHYRVGVQELASRRRQRRMLVPRQVGMYLARRLTGHSLDDIGQYFGGRDHTTVLHACRKIKNAVDADVVLAGSVRQLCADLA